MIKGNKTLVRSIVLAVAALIVSIFISKRLAAPKKMAGPKISFREATVPVRPAVYEVHQASVTASGRVKALNRFEIYAEVSGILRTDAFRAGTSFNKGAVLVQVDDQEFAVQLKAQKSAFMGLMSQVLPDLATDYREQYKLWADFAAQIEVDKALPELPNLKAPQLKSFLSGRGVLNQYYALKSQELRLSKHQIRAPYSGVLSEVAIQPGSLVRVGQRLGLFIEPNVYELEAAVPESDLDKMRIGTNMQLYSDPGETLYAQVTRVNATVDPQTQLVKVYLKLQGSNIREGQFYRFVAGGKTVAKSMKIPRTWITERRTIYGVNAQDSTLYEIPIIEEAMEDDQVIVTGFNEGALILQRSVAGAFEGMKVVPQLPKK